MRTEPEKRTVGKFTVIIRHEYDDSPDTSWLGEYTDKPEFPAYDRATGAIVRSWDDVDQARYWDRREYRFIHGFQDPSDHNGMILDAKRIEDYGKGWAMLVVTAKARIDGHTFGTASLGIESDSDESYFREIEEDLISEAIDMANKEFSRFCSEHCKH